jgi:superfamily II DNA or RNA helicase
METKLTHKGYSIPYNDVHYQRIKKDLMVKPYVLPDYDFNNDPFPVYRKNTKTIYLPKYYGIEKYGPPSKTNEREGDDIDIEFKGSLRPLQIKISEDVIKTIKDKGSTVLSLYTGAGKTVIGLYTISRIKKKALIIVHKEFLLNQWVDRIKQFLPDARIGIIQQNKIDIENKDIVIAMLQSISVRKVSYPKETFDSFGYTLLDECFKYNQLVVTENGPVKIGSLFNLWKQSERSEDVKVLSYNEKLDSFEYKPITHVWEKENNELLKINYDNNTKYDIECTDNHLILTPNGYIKADELKIGDSITGYSKILKIKSIEKIENEGDGYNGKVYDIEVQDNHNFVLATGDRSNVCSNGPIVHNCHRVCSKTFSKALFQVSTKHGLGLSATPNRKDGLTKVLNWFLGDITVIDTKNEELKPEVKLVVAKYNQQPVVKYNIMGKVNLPGLVTTISLDPKRNIQILEEIMECNKQGRKILVLSERRQQCVNLLNMLPKNISGGLYVGGMKSADLDISNTKDVILATYSMAHEGYDNSVLDTLIMATGRTSIEQTCGRILRRKNKNNPLIVDFQDHIEGLQGQGRNRVRYYKSKKYKVLGGKDESNKKTIKCLFVDD